MSGEKRSRAVTARFFMALIFLVVPIRSALTADSSFSSGVLDGMNFVGKLGPAGKPLDRDDTVYFGDGQFWSMGCVRCGFQPGAYYVRNANGGIEFQGVLESIERGRLIYSGTVRDGRISASINWRKDRWYWAIDKAFWFEGVLDGGIEARSPEQAARLASAADSVPEDCRL